VPGEIKTRGSVQDCGCIALPAELQSLTGLYPGATFEFQADEDGSSVTLTLIQKADISKSTAGAACGVKADQ
jgi:hypothetical protein